MLEPVGSVTRKLNTLVTMISQAGPRFEGSTALNSVGKVFFLRSIAAQGSTTRR